MNLTEKETREQMINPILERAGTGIKRIRDACVLNKNRVEIKPLETYFFVEIFPSKDYYKMEDVPENIPENRLINIIEIMKKNSKITIPEIARELNVNEKTIKRDIEKIRESGRVKRIGPDKGGHWEILTK